MLAAGNSALPRHSAPDRQRDGRCNVGLVAGGTHLQLATVMQLNKTLAPGCS